MNAAPLPPGRVTALTALALAGFAANSLLARVALRDPANDPLAFTFVRIAAGAAMLLGLSAARGLRPAGDWASAGALLIYAAAFSVAYRALPAGLGALLLFGAVQLTMIVAGLRGGERPRAVDAAGQALAFAGLIVLLRPGPTAPPLAGAALMLVSGIAWGVYSLRGRRSRMPPLAATAGHFLFAVPLAAVLLAGFGRFALTGTGLACGLASGALASGLGYALWYAVLPQFKAIRASALQILVPLLVAVAGVLLLGETADLRLLAGGGAIIGGLALAVLVRGRRGGAR